MGPSLAIPGTSRALQYLPWVAVEVEPLLAGDTRALAQAISAIETRQPGTGDLIQELLIKRAGQAESATQIVGLTGPPGSGKSTLADGLTALWRGQGRRVAILAVDPNSPFTGGAILGDRVRMQRHALDRGVFIRSMGARGHLGGVSLATRGTVRLLSALGWEMVLVETVGVGQSELEICEIADSVVVVTTPAAGDGVQVIKAGITEIADLFAVNKADLAGTDRVVRELRDLVRAHREEGVWRVPVIPTVASSGMEGVTELATALDQHRAHLRASGAQEARAERRLRDEVVELVGGYATDFARRLLSAPELGPLPEDLRSGNPEQVAEGVLRRLAAQESKIEVADHDPAANARRSE
ncbi:MAG TPA: methylmalonyl Co-A mutase-associated GTPase MeaB [Candidatus Dormibacteraeota bacterium]|nr:methylmalonyl Co-A mutase-associated GTPase MeaB [Candidatus Dormibacteraeota bacterium]